MPADFILPHRLDEALEGHSPKLLSLDCFDTLLWRLSHSPRCLFAALPVDPAQRRLAETRARARARLTRRTGEVGMEEIAAMLLPGADAEARAATVAAELAVEAGACFAFAPTVALMHAAKERGIAVAIVSDTYLSAAQLRALIAAAAGEEVAGLIDHVFASSEHGMSKSEGLFRPVLAALGLAPGEVLHIGDSRAADVDAPARLGIPALHLRQFDPETEQRLRLEAACAAMLGEGRAAPAWQPHRAAVAIGEPQLGHPALRLGFSVLGPLFTAFDAWLKEEAAALAARTPGRVHALFLLRDGHLPHAFWEARGGSAEAAAHRVEISRYCAVAAGFRSEADVDDYLARDGGAEPRQLVRQLLHSAPPGPLTRAAAVAGLRRPREVRETIKRSRQFARRLCAHVRAACDPRPGDTVMLVDLGYNGTVQNAVDAVLAEEFEVRVAGRYLLLREDVPSGLDKAGLIDRSSVDEAVLTSLCDNIAALEQLATLGQGSVVDYAANGTPIRSAPSVGAAQSVVRDAVQEAALEYARAAPTAWHRPPAALRDDAARRSSVAALLARFLYLPLESELEVLAAFEHDVNLGGETMVPLFDRALGAGELRRRGFASIADGERMCQPAELRGQGLPLSLALLAQRRFAMDLRRPDFDDGGLTLPILVARGREVVEQAIVAARTHDGFHAATVPVGAMAYSVGLLLGRLFEFVELDSASFLPVHALNAPRAVQERVRIPAVPSLENVETVGPGLLRLAPDGFVMVPPARAPGEEEMVLVLVFRPLRARAEVAADVPHPEATRP